MIFLTVGTMFPFDRLVRAVDTAADCGAIRTEVLAQVGLNSKYRPRNFEVVETLPRSDYIRILGDCEAVISHAGIGTIVGALEAHKPLLVMARLSRFREHVNDHQLGTAKRFAERGKMLFAANEEELVRLVPELLRFRPPELEKGENTLVQRLRTYLDRMETV